MKTFFFSEITWKISQKLHKDLFIGLQLSFFDLFDCPSFLSKKYRYV